MQNKEFTNHLLDYKGGDLLASDGRINAAFREKLLSHIGGLVRELEFCLDKECDWGDQSVYTGTAGIALLYLNLHDALDEGLGTEKLQKALQYVEPTLSRLHAKRYTLLCGDAGPLTMGAIIYNKLGRPEDCQNCIKRLLSLHVAVCGTPSLPDELLYGRAGYLSALLLLQRHLGAAAVPDHVINKVYGSITDSGRALSQQENCSCPLMYEWHDKKYLGAAHGLSGIIHTLLQVDGSRRRSDTDSLFLPTVQYLRSLCFPSGNYPSSVDSASRDRLVQWCHGAPGWVDMFLTIYQRTGSVGYLDAAQGCGNVVWQRGLLRKGHGLCHGTAGNAYSFLALYRATQDQKHLHRACQFAEWCMEANKHDCRTPDRPLSLFEGLADVIYFLADLINPTQARFPGY